MSVFPKKIRSDKSISGFFNDFDKKQIKNEEELLEEINSREREASKDLKNLVLIKKENSVNKNFKNEKKLNINKKIVKTKKESIKKSVNLDKDKMLKEMFNLDINISKENLEKLIKIKEDRIFLLERKFKLDESSLSKKIRDFRVKELNDERKEYKQLLEISDTHSKDDLKKIVKKNSKKDVSKIKKEIPIITEDSKEVLKTKEISNSSKE